MHFSLINEMIPRYSLFYMQRASGKEMECNY